MKEFSKRLKEERNKQKMTQQDLAEKLHVSRTSISNWEVGRNYPDLETLVTLSDVLQISLDHLLKEDTNMVESYAQEIKVSRKRSWWIKLLGGVLIGLVLLGLLGMKLFVIGWTAERRNVIIEYQNAPDSALDIRIGSKEDRRIVLEQNDAGEVRVVEKLDFFFMSPPQKYSYYAVHSSDEEFSSLQFKEGTWDMDWENLHANEKEYGYKSIE